MMLQVEGLKELLVRSFKTLQKWKNRLADYRKAPTADQHEADRREKELQIFISALEQTIVVLELYEQKVLVLSSQIAEKDKEIKEMKQNARFFHEAWQANIEENLFLTNLLQNAERI